MHNNYKISIIMAAYNAEKSIRAAISSVISQTYTNWELLVINDCSKDNTEKIVKSFNDQRIHLINNDKNLGVSKSRFKALNSASGQWIAILDSDDIWKKEKLEHQLHFAYEKKAKLTFTGSSYITEDDKKIDCILHVPSKITYKQLLKQNLISNSSVLVDKKLFSENFVICDAIHEDFAMWLTITQKGHVAYGLDKDLLIYRLSKTSKTGNKLKSALMNWKTYRYIHLNQFLSAYYMIWYSFNGAKKYFCIHKSTKTLNLI